MTNLQKDIQKISIAFQNGTLNPQLTAFCWNGTLLDHNDRWHMIKSILPEYSEPAYAALNTHYSKEQLIEMEDHFLSIWADGANALSLWKAVDSTMGLMISYHEKLITTI